MSKEYNTDQETTTSSEDIQIARLVGLGKLGLSITWKPIFNVGQGVNSIFSGSSDVILGAALGAKGLIFDDGKSKEKAGKLLKLGASRIITGIAAPFLGLAYDLKDSVSRIWNAKPASTTLESIMKEQKDQSLMLLMTKEEFLNYQKKKLEHKELNDKISKLYKMSDQHKKANKIEISGLNAKLAKLANSRSSPGTETTSLILNILGSLNNRSQVEIYAAELRRNLEKKYPSHRKSAIVPGHREKKSYKTR